MKTCAACGMKTNDSACPGCGEASWTSELPAPRPVKKRKATSEAPEIEVDEAPRPRKSRPKRKKKD